MVVDVSMKEQSVKVTYQGNVRRFAVSSYEMLQERLQKLLGKKEAALMVTYVDEEGDDICLSGPADFEEALKSCGQVLRLKQATKGLHWKGKGKGWHPECAKGKGKGWHSDECEWADCHAMDVDHFGKGHWGKGKGKGWPCFPSERGAHAGEYAERLEAAAGKPLCSRRVLMIMKRADWNIEAAEDTLRQRREKREAKLQGQQQEEEACLEGTTQLAEVFPDMPLPKVKWALAKAGGDVDAAASQLAVWSELLTRKREEKKEWMLKCDALAQRLNEAGYPRGPWRIMQLLKKTGGDVEAAVKIVESNVAKRKGKGAQAKQRWAAWKMGMGAWASAAANDTSSSSSDSDIKV